MTRIEKSIELAHAATDMFALVCDVRSYPEFLRWFVDLEVLDEYQTPGLWQARAQAIVRYAGVTGHFTTAIQASRINLSIDVSLIEGSLRHLENHWRFQASDKGCRVDFVVEFDFANPLMRLLGQVKAHRAGDRLACLFAEEAERRFERAHRA